MFGFLKSVSCTIQINLKLLRNENQNVLFTCIVFFLSLDECTFKRTVDIDCIRISKRIYRPCLRRVSRNATRFCIIYMYSWNYCNSSCFSCECSVHYIGLVYTAVHCWKYFYPTSKFGTKNPKLGSNNPFVLSVNCVPIFGLTMIKIVG